MSLFSIVVPTRNRAVLLKQTLQTAISQEFDDYEIIVSDNNSTDNTKDVAEHFIKLSDKVKYFNTAKDCSMCESWEFALSKAGGEYILYLSDDDALPIYTLKYLISVIKNTSLDVLLFTQGTYYHLDIPDVVLKGKFTFPPVLGDLYPIDPRAVLRLFCSFSDRTNLYLPRMLNCVVSKKVIQKCMDKTEIFFTPPFPDYSAGIHLLCNAEKLYFFNTPLYIGGASRLANSGILYARKQTIDSYTSLFNKNLLDEVVFPMRHLVFSYQLATILAFQKLYPNKIPGSINKDEYLHALFIELSCFADYEDISDDLNLLKDYMKNYYGNDGTFNRLAIKHLRPKNIKQIFEKLKQYPIKFIKQVVKSGLKRNDFIHRQSLRIRHNCGFSKDHLFLDVPSITEASKILSKELSRIVINCKTNIDL